MLSPRDVEHERIDDAGKRQGQHGRVEAQQRPFDEAAAAVAALGRHLEFVPLRLRQPGDDGLDDRRRRDELATRRT